MAFENQYSLLDRALHRIAFSSWSAQAALSDMENSLFKDELNGIEIHKPVFVTALPRAGTTLLLELCVNTEEFVSHTYRDMPFLLCPMLWDKLASSFKQEDSARERAHGDGMLVSVDSAEAFEEIVWRLFWKKHYQKNYIIPWEKSSDPEFESFFKDHIKKIIALRSRKDGYVAQRYISKNNLNISRLNYLKRLFPDTTVIVPFRDPLQHAFSLLKQHRNFLAIHQEDSFAKSYMRAIGHYDFGENLKPVNFSGWAKKTGNADTLEFWLRYWLATYQYILNIADDRICLLSYEALCNNPSQGLQTLGGKLQFKNLDAFTAQSERISLPKPYDIDTSDIDPQLLTEINLLNQALEEKSIFPG